MVGPADRPAVAVQVGAVVGLAGWIAMAFTTEVWMAFALNLTVPRFAGATAH